MYKLAIIDFDGTLCSTHEAARHVIGLTFSDHGQPVPPADAIDRLISSGVVVEEVFATLLGLPSGHQQCLDWGVRYREIYNSGEGLARSVLFPGVREGLQKLDAAGCRKIVLSNKGIVALEQALVHFGLHDQFEMILGDRPGFVRKPEPGSYSDVVAPRFPAITPAQTLMVGDTVTDIRFARNIGAAVAWARYGFGDREACQALAPDLTLDSFAEVARFAA